MMAVAGKPGSRMQSWVATGSRPSARTGTAAIWVAHPGTGLSRYQPESDTWEVYSQVDGALNWPSVPGVDSQGQLWTGDEGELVYFDGQGWQTFTAPELVEASIHAIEFGPGDVQWIATDRGLMRYDPAGG